jgi:hypothetical protein
MTLGAARVIWRINDLSLFVDEVVRGYVTMVIKAERGEMGVARIISTMEEYRKRYGKKVSWTTDPLVVEMALRQGARLNLIRTAHYDDPADPTTLTATKAQLTLYDRADTAGVAVIESEVGPFALTQKLSGRFLGTEVGPFTFVTGESDKLSFTVNAGTAQELTLTGTLTTQGVADYINAHTTGMTASAVYDEGSGAYVLKVWANTITHSLGVITITDSAYALLGLPLTTTTDAAEAGTDNLILSVDGEATQSLTLAPIAGEEGDFTLTTGQVVQRMQAFEDVYVYANEGKVRIETLTSGTSATLQFSSSTALTPLGFDTDEVAGTAAGSSQATLRIDALNEGDWGDDLKVIITDSLLHEDLYFNLRIINDRQGDMEEYYPDMSMDSESERYVVNFVAEQSFLVDVVDLHSATASPLNMPVANGTGDYLHGGSNGIDEEGGYFVGSELGPFTFVTGTDDTLLIQVGADAPQTITLSGAAKTLAEVVIQINDSLSDATATSYNNKLKIQANDDTENIHLQAVTHDAYTVLGLTADTYLANDGFDDADWIGDAAAQTGIYAADTTYMSMDLMVPGTVSATVYNAMITYCENRGDMMGYGATPPGNDPEDTVAWRMGTGNYTHPAFNSHRFSLWFGRPLVFDDRDSAKRYIPNLGHLASCLCRTDNDYGSHYAPVGPRRGAVQLVEGIDFNIQDYRSTGYADLFAEYGINYLMISKMPGIEGAMFWEQRTTQRAPSATRELNVMRFITVVNRTLMPVLRTFLFEPNHPVTWREIHRVLEPAFDSWKNKYAIYDYCLQTDRDAFFDGGELKNAVLNSGLDIDRGLYRCRALIQPTRAIYYLEFELGVMRTGESFENYKSMKYLPGWVRS